MWADRDMCIFKRRSDQFLSTIKYFCDTIQFFPGACPTQRQSVRRCITQSNYFKRFGERSKARAGNKREVGRDREGISTRLYVPESTYELLGGTYALAI